MSKSTKAESRKAKPVAEVQANEPVKAESDHTLVDAGPPDIDQAEQAYGRVASVLDGLDARTLVRVTVDAQEVALVALTVAARLRDPKRAALVAGLAKLDLARKGDIDGLGDAALACWFARHKLLEAAGVASTAALPASLRDDAKACRKRMRSSLEYNVPKKETKGWELLDHYRAGRGDLDLANDLDGYAGMYVAPYLQYLVDDRTNYRAGDRALAKSLAARMRGHLSSAETPEAAKWTAAQQRAVTLCKARYEEAARVGKFIDRDDSGVEYPNLTSAVRAAPTRKKVADEVEGDGKGKPPEGGAKPG